jgi:hypothetical protein
MYSRVVSSCHRAATAQVDILNYWYYYHPFPSANPKLPEFLLSSEAARCFILRPFLFTFLPTAM